MSKYRFKTEEEFKSEGLWKSWGGPEGWNSDKRMNKYLGQVIPEQYTTRIDSLVKGDDTFHMDDWTFRKKHVTLNTTIETVSYVGRYVEYDGQDRLIIGEDHTTWVLYYKTGWKITEGEISRYGIDRKFIGQNGWCIIKDLGSIKSSEYSPKKYFVDDEVQISDTGGFPGQGRDSNGTKLKGIVMDNNYDSSFLYKVHWSNGSSNAYRFCDIEPYTGQSSEILPKFHIGNLVQIQDSSAYYKQGCQKNGDKMKGTVTEFYGIHDALPYRVEWENGNHNTYNERDLEVYVQKEKPVEIPVTSKPEPQSFIGKNVIFNGKTHLCVGQKGVDLVILYDEGWGITESHTLTTFNIDSKYKGQKGWYTNVDCIQLDIGETYHSRVVEEVKEEVTTKVEQKRGGVIDITPLKVKQRLIF